MIGYVCSSRELAHYVIQYCTLQSTPISNLQLQKILYFLQTVFGKSYGRLLFKERFEAWPYGPVLPDIYYEYSSYGSSLISEVYPELDAAMFSSIRVFLDNGIDFLRSKSPWDLVKLAHAEGSPWHSVWRNGDGRGSEIPNELLLGDAERQAAESW